MPHDTPRHPGFLTGLKGSTAGYVVAQNQQYRAKLEELPEVVQFKVSPDRVAVNASGPPMLQVFVGVTMHRGLGLDLVQLTALVFPLHR